MKKSVSAAVSLGNRIDEYFATTFAGRAATTVRRARFLMDELQAFTGERRLDTSWYSSWISHCHDHWSPSTARLAMVQTDRFLRWMELMGYIERSPHRSVRKPVLAAPAKRKEAITPEEYARLKQATVGTPLHFAVILGWAASSTFVISL